MCDCIFREVEIFEREWCKVNNCHKLSKIGEGKLLHWGVDFHEFDQGIGNYTVGIVEMPNGTIRSIVPEFLKFKNPNVVMYNELPVEKETK